jgi:hypothetical protein
LRKGKKTKKGKRSIIETQVESQKGPIGVVSILANKSNINREEPTSQLVNKKSKTQLINQSYEDMTEEQ